MVPVQNGYIESFNGRLRDECLNGEIFFGLADARKKLERWRQDYPNYGTSDHLRRLGLSLRAVSFSGACHDAEILAYCLV